VVLPQLEVQVDKLFAVGRARADRADRLAGGDLLPLGDDERREVRVVRRPVVRVLDDDGVTDGRVRREGIGSRLRTP
jgi:hypothetical protein